MSENKIGALLKEIGFLNFKRMFPKFKSLGIYPGQDKFLNIIIKDPGISQSKLAEITGREAATITKAIQRLIVTGHIMKKQDSKDKRISCLYPTELGIETYNKYQQLVEKDNEYLKCLLNEEETEYLINVLSKLKTEMEKNNEENI